MYNLVNASIATVFPSVYGWFVESKARFLTTEYEDRMNKEKRYNSLASVPVVLRKQNSESKNTGIKGMCVAIKKRLLYGL